MTKLPDGLDRNPLEDSETEEASPENSDKRTEEKLSSIKVLRDYRKHPVDHSLHILNPGVTIDVDMHDGAYFQLALTGRYSHVSAAVSALYKDIQALQDTIHPQLVWVIGELFTLLVNGGEVEAFSPERSPTIIKHLSRTILALMSKVPAFASLMTKCKGSVFLSMTAMRGVVNALKDLEIPPAEYSENSPYQKVELFEEMSPESSSGTDGEESDEEKKGQPSKEKAGGKSSKSTPKNRGKGKSGKSKGPTPPAPGNPQENLEGNLEDGEGSDSESGQSQSPGQQTQGKQGPFNKLTDWIDKNSPPGGSSTLMTPPMLKSIRAIEEAVKKSNADINKLIELSKAINRPERGWGPGSAKPQRVTDEALASLAEKLSKNPNLQQVLELMGKMLDGIYQQREDILERLGESAVKASHEPTGNPLEAILSQQAMLADEDLELLFLKQAADGDLRKPSSLEEKLDRKGGIAVYCDLSGSMYGLPAQTALAFAGAMCILCSQSGRPYLAAAFDTRLSVFEFEKDASPLEVALQVCSVELGGGTDFNPVFEHFLSQPPEFLKTSDMVLLSDGMGPLKKDTVEKFAKGGTRLFYIVIGTLADAATILLGCAKDSEGAVFVAKSLDPEDSVLLEAAATALAGQKEE